MLSADWHICERKCAGKLEAKQVPEVSARLEIKFPPAGVEAALNPWASGRIPSRV